MTTLELSSVKFQPEAYLQFVALVDEMPQLMTLIINRSIVELNAKLLVNAVLRNRTLQGFYLVHNEVADGAFVGLSDIREPSALRHVCFIRDKTVSFKTLEAICNASMDGVLNLESLVLGSNAQIGDQGIHALAPMLAPPAVGPMRLLTRLKVSDCKFGLQGVTSLLQALGPNKTVKYLDIADNAFGADFGDVLADFLLTNSSVTDLKAYNVRLRSQGVSARLLAALESNFTLTSLWLYRNDLGDEGTTAILGPLLRRAQLKPFTHVDLSCYSITLSGLEMIAGIFESLKNADVPNADSFLADSTNGRNEDDVPCRKQRRIDCSDKGQEPSISCNANIILFEEFCLRNRCSYSPGYERECAPLLESIQRRVGRLKSKQ